MTAELARAFASLTTGIYVLTVADGDQYHGMSASWVTQVSAQPPLLMVAVGRAHSTHAILARSGCFGLSVVGQRSRHLEDFFYSAASRRPNNLETIDFELSPTGVPLLRAALLGLACRVNAVHAAGDRSLFVASVEHVRWGADDAPLTSLDLDYVYVGAVVPQPHRRQPQSVE